MPHQIRSLIPENLIHSIRRGHFEDEDDAIDCPCCQRGCEKCGLESFLSDDYAQHQNVWRPFLHLETPRLEKKIMRHIISQTPLRISLFGGGTDYPDWYREHGGAVISTSIDKYCYIVCRYLTPFFDHKYRIRYTYREETNSIEEIKHPSVRECLKFLKINRNSPKTLAISIGKL